jgi:hypothetical protein
LEVAMWLELLFVTVLGLTVLSILGGVEWVLERL